MPTSRKTSRSRPLNVSVSVSSRSRTPRSRLHPWYSGILWTWKTPGILREFCWFCATSRKNCNKRSIFSSLFKYLCETAVDWVNRSIMTLDEGHYYIYLFCDDCGKVSLSLWESLENSEFFSPTLWPPDDLSCNVMYIVSSFVALTLLVGLLERRPTYKKTCCSE